MLLALLASASTVPALDAILDNPKLSGAVVSAYVMDADGRELYSRNPALHMVPGSNEKLVTISFALNELGQDYRPNTRFWKLKDKLVVDSPGDPMLSYDQILKIRATLKLNGKLPVQVSQAYRPMIPPGWEWDDLPNKYAAPITAFTVDRGSFELWAKSGRLQLRPRNYGVSIRHVPGSQPAKVRYEPWKSVVTVLGRISEGEKRLDTLALPVPDAAAASLLGSTLTLSSKIPSTPPTFVQAGTPMVKMVKEALTESDNHVAEHLLLTAGGVKPTDTDPYDVATDRAKQFLEEVVGAEVGDFRPQDGSGLNRHNFVTSRGIARVLSWADRQGFRDLWRRALANPGEGTLEGRLQGVTFAGKTGTLDAVVALSGYLQLADGKEVIVAIFLNNFVCRTVEARDLADEFIKTVLASGNEGTLFADPHEHEGSPPNPRYRSVDRSRAA